VYDEEDEIHEIALALEYGNCHLEFACTGLRLGVDA
jgi:hypothetical protein